MAQIFIFLAAIFGGLSVATGAFGAHSMQGRYSEYAMEVFEKAVKYEMFHALALLAVGLLAHIIPSARMLTYSGLFFAAGIILFSGSLYLIAFTGTRMFGMITPIGGVSFIVGWVLLAIAAWQLGK